MCFMKDKWKQFLPTTKYLAVVKELDTVEKISDYTRWFTFTADVVDMWKTPVELLNDGEGDCEDFARWYVDILVRIIGITEARFIVYNGLDSKKRLTGHGVCVFPYQGKLAMFTNNVPPILGFTDFIEAGHYFYPNGLKYMECRDYTGKITYKKRKWIGTY